MELCAEEIIQTKGGFFVMQKPLADIVFQKNKNSQVIDLLATIVWAPNFYC